MKKISGNPMGFGVRFKTELCDAHGRVERILNQGHNEITDWGMDALATANITSLVNYLHLSDTIGPVTRSLTGGTTLSLVITSPTSIAVTASSNFFLSGDAGNTLWIDGLGQELKIVTFNSATSVTCATRPGAWLPSVGTPGTGPFSTASVHFTSVNTLANQTQKFSTFDTTATNHQTTLNDSGNSRWNTQRIWLSGVVTGSAWTVKQLGWSDGNGSNNVFGKVNLSATDTIPVGKRYRVTANFYSVYTPLNLTGATLDFGTTVGSYTANIRQEVMPNEANGGTRYSAFTPFVGAALASAKIQLFTGAFSLLSTKWEGDSGYSDFPHGAGTSLVAPLADSSYVTASHTKIRTWTFSDTIVIPSCSAFTLQDGGNLGDSQSLTFLPTSNFSKPTGWLCGIPFQIFWTRELVS